jgi:hypothetical protein
MGSLILTSPRRMAAAVKLLRFNCNASLDEATPSGVTMLK